VKKKIPRCRHCNYRIVDPEKLMDPQDELCDECYLKLDELDEVTIILELNVKIKNSSLSEIIDYVKNFATYTADIDSYNINFKRR